MGLAELSPFLVGLERLLTAVLTARLAPIGVLAVIAAPGAFHLRLSETLLQSAAWLDPGVQLRTNFEGLYQDLAVIASGILIEDLHPVALILTDARGTIQFIPNREALRSCGLRPRTLHRLHPILVDLITRTLLTTSQTGNRIHWSLAPTTSGSSGF
jgi:hypothetical protein